MCDTHCCAIQGVSRPGAFVNAWVMPVCRSSARPDDIGGGFRQGVCADDSRTVECMRKTTTQTRLLLIAALLAAFGFIAEDVIEGETRAFDEAVLLSLRVSNNPQLPIGPPWLVEAARDVTALGSFSVLGILLLLLVLHLLLERNVRRAALIAGSVVTGTAISTALKHAFNRPRPDLTAVTQVFTASFPSGHALVSAVTFLTIGTVLAGTTDRVGFRVFYVGGAIFLTLLVGFSRIYLGVHYPTDVIAGWSLGAAWSIICFLVARAFGSQST